MTELIGIKLFLIGFILWWTAYGAISYKPSLLLRLSTDRLILFLMAGSGYALYLMARGYDIAYMIVSTVMGAMWAALWSRRKFEK